jgi:hypothetical protein
MKIMKIALITIGVLIALLICMYTYYGGFKKIIVKVENQGGEVIVYESVTGDYKDTPKYTDKVYYALLNDEKIKTSKGIGIFYDNPQKTEKAKCRSEAESLSSHQQVLRRAWTKRRYCY